MRTIAAVTLLATLMSGAAMHLVDRREFPTIARGLWWAVQTVTTVGYGDAVPHATAGRVVAIVVMLSAIAFVTVVTAAITAILIDRGRGGSSSPEEVLVEINGRLARLEAALHATPRRARAETKPNPMIRSTR